MAITATQTGAEGVPNYGGNCDADRRFICSVGAIAGFVSISSSVASVGAGVQREIAWRMMAPGTATWEGVATVLLDITTANTNVTWSRVIWCAVCNDGISDTGSAITSTSGLGISLGTTGVKTASVGIAATTIDLGGCGTATAASFTILEMSNAATMAAVFNWIPRQYLIFPSDAGTSTPAAADVYNLATTRAGK